MHHVKVFPYPDLRRTKAALGGKQSIFFPPPHFGPLDVHLVRFRPTAGHADTGDRASLGGLPAPMSPLSPRTDCPHPRAPPLDIVLSVSVPHSSVSAAPGHTSVSLLLAGGWLSHDCPVSTQAALSPRMGSASCGLRDTWLVSHIVIRRRMVFMFLNGCEKQNRNTT